MDPEPAPDALLPLPPAVLHILIALAEEDRHGYGIIQAVAVATDGAVRLGPGTLYEAIQRLQDAGLIRETGGDADPVNGQEAQRRYYMLTARGRRVLRTEMAKLGRLVDYARSKPELA